MLEYTAMPEGSQGRLLLERRYGRANILRLVAKAEEDRANREWLENSTMACPFCHVRVQKSMGCNHVSRLTCTLGEREHSDVKIDDVCKVQASFLLPLWVQVGPGESIPTLFDAK